MTNPDPTELALAGDAAVLVNFMPYLRAEVDKMQRDVESRAYAGLRDHSLTPEQALSLWREKLAAADLLRRFDTRIKMGHTMAVKHTDALDRMPR